MKNLRNLLLPAAIVACMFVGPGQVAPARASGTFGLLLLQQPETNTQKINGGRTIIETTETRDSTGKVIKRVTVTKDYDRPNGKVIKSTEKTEDLQNKTSSTKTTENSSSGTKTTETVTDSKGTRTVLEKTTDPNGKAKSETDYDENGKKSHEYQYDPPGKLKKETEWENGKLKKSTEYDSKGEVKKTTEYGKDGKPETETEYDEKGNPKKVTKYEKGKKKSETEYDSNGKEIANKSVEPFRAILPQNIVPGETFSFTVVNLAGQVVADKEVTIDGGPNGSITGTTDLHGVVVAKAPDNWKTARVLLGGAGVAMLADKLIGGGGGQPAIQTGPSFATPGSIMNLRGTGFSGDANSAVVHVGNMPAKVLASSPTALRVIVPANAPVGETAVTYSDSQSPTTSQPASFKVTVVKLRLQASSTTLHTGQAAQADLIVEGTQAPVQVQVSTAQGSTIQLTKGSGTVTTSGGQNNRVTIPFRAISVGPFDISATLPKTGETDYEKDLANAEAARRDAAGWRDSAAADSDEDVAAAKRIAAGHADKAAADWDAAAEARKHGDDKKAAAFEDAAKAREEAAKAYGSDRDPGRGAAAGKDAGAKEEKARSGG